MRKLFIPFFILALFANCNKDKISDCRLISLQNSSTGTQVKYGYDGQGRIIKVSDGTLITTLDYFKDSVVLSDGTTYFLNSAGLATSSKLKFKSPELLSLEGDYTYDNEGYLIKVQQVFSQLYNGNILRDTSILNFTIQNGNIVKQTNSQGNFETFYEYSSKEHRQNSAFTMNIFSPWPFLGKSSKNLVSTAKDGQGNVIYAAKYSFDSKGNLAKRIMTSPNNAVSGSIQYNYQCN
jgi:YD repeat-containing protein